MISFPPQHDGILVYTQVNTSDPELGRTVELLIENPKLHHYLIDFFGNYLPYFRIKVTPEVDRVFVQLPPVDDMSVYPLYIEKTFVNRIVYDNFFYWYDDMFDSEHLFTTDGAVHYVDQNGLRIDSGKIAVDTTECPIKIKGKIFNSDFHAKFYLYDLANELLKFTVEINDGAVTVNDTAAGTVVIEDEAEFDLGFTEDEFRINFFDTDGNLIDYVSDDTPLNTDAPDAEYSIEIEGGSITLVWLFCYKGALEPTSVIGIQPYTDFEGLITAGEPRLTSRTYFGIRSEISEFYEAILGTQRQIAAGTFYSAGMKLTVAEQKAFSAISEVFVQGIVSKDYLAEVAAYQDILYSTLAEVEAAVLTMDIEFGTKEQIRELIEDINTGVKAAVQQYTDKFLGLQRTIGHFEEYEFESRISMAMEFMQDVELAMLTKVEQEISIADIIQILMRKATEEITISVKKLNLVDLSAYDITSSIEVE